jgi:acetylornithine deacetylase
VFVDIKETKEGEQGMDALDVARRLVGFDTTSEVTSGAEMADYICNLCSDLDFNVTRYPYTHEKGKGLNIVATKGGAKPYLAFSGHMDTVPVEVDEKAIGDKPKYPGWKVGVNPYSLTPHEDRYYGRGIADMKGFLAIAIVAGGRVKASELKKPFALYFTSNEEVGCIGAKNLLGQDGFQVAPRVVIGEPTSMQPVVLHKGYMYVLIEVTTQIDLSVRDVKRSVHSSDDRTTPNVVELVLPTVIQTLHGIRTRLMEISDERLAPQYPTLNIGRVIMPSGSAKNIIPSKVGVEIDVRPIPGQEHEDLLGLIRTKLQREVAKIGSGIQGVSFSAETKYCRLPTPPMDTPIDCELAQELARLTGQTPGRVAFNTEGGLFNAAGAQTVICGPASISNAHCKDEYADARWFQEDVIQIYESLTRSCCC